MGKFDGQLERMKSLMTYGVVSESENKSKSIEYKAIAADGKTYGIVRECNKYYIKVATPGKENLTEGFDYVGGFMNKNEHEYSSFANALKQFELKLKSINEAYDVKVNIETLDPYRKEDLVIEGTEKMKDEIARQRQIMNNVSALMCEAAQIGMNNTGNPEAPKTSGLDTAKSAPFTDKAEAKLDSDLKATANNPEKQSEPFGDNSKVEDYTDAQYVPDNSVANKKPSGGKVVRVNEGIEDEEELLLDNNDEEMPEDMDASVETEELIDGEEMPEDDFEEDMDFEDEDDDLLARIEELEAELAQLRAEVDGEEMPEEDFEEDMDFESEEEMPEGECEGEECENAIEEAEEVKKGGRKIGSTNNISGKTGGFRNFEQITQMPGQIGKWATAMQEIFNTLTEAMNGNMSPEEASKLVEEADELCLNIIESTQNTAIKTIVNAKNDAIFTIYYKYLGGSEYEKEIEASLNYGETNNDEDERFIDDEDDFNDDFWGDDESNHKKAMMAAKQANESLNKMITQMIKEEMTKLNVFGKHPGYRKKPMNLPQTGSDDFQGNKDWNDESVRSEKPFGEKIGSSAPFDKLVSELTEMIYKDIKKKM